MDPKVIRRRSAADRRSRESRSSGIELPAAAEPLPHECLPCVSKLFSADTSSKRKRVSPLRSDSLAGASSLYLYVPAARKTKTDERLIIRPLFARIICLAAARDMKNTPLSVWSITFSSAGAGTLPTTTRRNGPSGAVWLVSAHPPLGHHEHGFGVPRSSKEARRRNCGMAISNHSARVHHHHHHHHHHH